MMHITYTVYKQYKPYVTCVYIYVSIPRILMYAYNSIILYLYTYTYLYMKINKTCLLYLHFEVTNKKLTDQS